MMSVFARSKPVRAVPLPISPLPTTPPSLPKDFAVTLLDLESQLNFNLSLPLISSLMQLYSVISIQSAIEYYESVNDKKYLHYKDRLQSLLTKDQVLEILSDSARPFDRPTDTASSKETLEENQRGKRRTHSVKVVKEKVEVKKDPEAEIKQNMAEMSNASSLVKESIRNQEGEHLQLRLQARKRASSAKPQDRDTVKRVGRTEEVFSRDKGVDWDSNENRGRGRRRDIEEEVV